jgi:arginyl-tRNA--protein-N-Asp/Glu arginylyltransferase
LTRPWPHRARPWHDGGVSKSRNLPLLLPGEPAEFLVYDELERCPYLPEQRARLPFRLPVRALSGEELDKRLEAGDRRNGPLLYKPSCPSCRACEPIRIDAYRFGLRERHRRTLRRGDRELAIEIGPTVATEDRVALYNLHLETRGLSQTGPRMDLEGYRHFLVESCCNSFEIRYYHEGRLAGVAVTDRGARSLSAVYCYYDTTLSHLGIGTYSILKQLELCRHYGLRHLYLGLYVEGCEAMGYKARFYPHERLVDGKWRVFDKPPQTAES